MARHDEVLRMNSSQYLNQKKARIYVYVALITSTPSFKEVEEYSSKLKREESKKTDRSFYLINQKHIINSGS